MPRLAKAFLYLIYVVIIGGLIAAIALSFHHDQAAAPAAPKVAQKQVGVAKKAITSTKPATAAQSRPTTTSQPAATPPANSSTQLTNTGPGNTIGLFVIGTLIGIFAYRKRLLHS